MVCVTLIQWNCSVMLMTDLCSNLSYQYPRRTIIRIGPLRTRIGRVLWAELCLGILYLQYKPPQPEKVRGHKGSPGYILIFTCQYTIHIYTGSAVRCGDLMSHVWALTSGLSKNTGPLGPVQWDITFPHRYPWTQLQTRPFLDYWKTIGSHSVLQYQ